MSAIRNRPTPLRSSGPTEGSLLLLLNPHPEPHAHLGAQFRVREELTGNQQPRTQLPSRQLQQVQVDLGEFVRPSESKMALGRSRASAYRDIAAGRLPPLHALGPAARGWRTRELARALAARGKKVTPCQPRAVGWPASEADALNAPGLAGLPEVEIRAPVIEPETTRKAAFGRGVR